MVAAKLANLPPHRPEKSANLPTSISQPQAASMLNVSERSVRSAVEVRERAAPEIATAVERGEVICFGGRQIRASKIVLSKIACSKRRTMRALRSEK
jgi:hypothetical protein